MLWRVVTFGLDGRGSKGHDLAVAGGWFGRGSVRQPFAVFVERLDDACAKSRRVSERAEEANADEATPRGKSGGAPR